VDVRAVEPYLKIFPGRTDYLTYTLRLPHYSRYALVIKAGGIQMRLSYLWNDESGQDIAEYAVMLAVILVLVVGTVRLIGSNANNAFSNVASSIQ
jgi:Flp pilus assembly pilin Flp